MDTKLARAVVLLVAALAGAATMVVELAAVRLLAPWFGASAGVWTNVIGVILLALSLGYLAGSRLASRPRPSRDLALLLALAAGWSAWLPALARPVCEWLAPREIPLDRASELMLQGSLAATMLLFLPAAALLGAVSPLCAECLQRRSKDSAGAAGGAVLCVSTLGSLAGTFGATHVLVPRLGLSWTFLVAAAGLLLAATLIAIAGGRARSNFAVAALALIVASGLAKSRVERSAAPAGVEVLAQVESPYQSIRVVEDRRWGEPQRLLQVNEGLDSFQSVWVDRIGLLGTGYYYDLFALPAWWARASERWRVAVIGLGAGTAFRVLEGASPPGVSLELSGLEIDERVIELGRRWFALEERGGAVLAGVDGRAGLRALNGPFDLIVLDAYQHQVEIPAHLATIEAFGELRAQLSPEGWIAVNVGGFGFDDPVVEALARTLAAACDGDCVGFRVPRSRNIVLFARAGARVPTPPDGEFWFDGPVSDALLAALSPQPCWRRFEAAREDDVLTDDKSALELFQQLSLEEARERLAAQN